MHMNVKKLQILKICIFFKLARQINIIFKGKAPRHADTLSSQILLYLIENQAIVKLKLWSGILLERQTVAYEFKNYSAFYETCTQELSTASRLEPNEASPLTPKLSFKDHFTIFLSYLHAQVFRVVSSLQAFQTKLCTHLLPRHAPNMPRQLYSS